MANELAVAYVNLVPSAKGIRAGIESELDLDSAAKKHGASAGKEFTGAFGVEAEKLKSVGTKMAAVGAVVGAGLFAAASAAGNLNAAISANEQVLGEASRTAQTWAKNSVEAVGLSERAAIEATTSFGGLAKIAGETGEGIADFSIGMVQAAADMAAFKDVPVDQALADLQSGFAGSTEVLRKYNIFLDDARLKQAYFDATGQKVTGTLTSQQRIIATHTAILEDGADMWGQWARESGELSAQQSKLKAEFENMSAEIGEVLLPAATQMVSAVVKGIGAFRGLNQATGGMIGVLGGVGAAMLTVGGGTLYAVGKAKQLRDTFAGMSAATKTASAGFGVLGVAVAAYAIHQQRAAQHAADMQRNLQALNDVADTELYQTFAEALLKASLGGKDLNETVGELVKTNIEGASRLRDYIEAQIDAGDSSEEAARNLKLLNSAIAEEEKRRARGQKTLDDYNRKTDESTAAVERATVGVGRASQAERDYINWLEDRGQEARDSASKVVQSIGLIQGSYDVLMGRLNQREAYLNIEQAFDDIKDTAVRAWEEATDGTITAEQAARDMERAQIDLKQEVIRYANEVARIPASRTTEILALIDQSKYDEALELLNKLAARRTAEIRVHLAGGRLTPDGAIDFGGGMLASAEGRFVPGGSNLPTTVGEIPGRAGDEVILPLGNPARLAQLVNHPRVAPAVSDALEGPRGGITINGVTIRESVDTQMFWQQANALLAVA